MPPMLGSPVVPYKKPGLPDGWCSLRIAQLMEQSPKSVLGKLAARFRRFPLLLKFLDVREMLSVQVHPPDNKADLIPKGETGKTEAWVILEAEAGSRVYAGLRPGTTAEDGRGEHGSCTQSELQRTVRCGFPKSHRTAWLRPSRTNYRPRSLLRNGPRISE